MSSTPTYKNLDALIEAPESGTYEFAEKATYTQIYVAKFSACFDARQTHGTIGSGVTLGYRVAKCTVEHTRGIMGKLTIVWEAGGGDDPGIQLPADEFDVFPENLSPRTERNKMFTGILPAALQVVKTALWGENEEIRQDAYDSIGGIAKTLVDKINAGNETFYLASLRYVWRLHSWSIPDIQLGGVIESPSGPLAGYFSPAISWLREADAFTEQGGVYMLTRSWLGAPSGHWDAQLYAA